MNLQNMQNMVICGWFIGHAIARNEAPNYKLDPVHHWFWGFRQFRPIPACDTHDVGCYFWHKRLIYIINEENPELSSWELFVMDPYCIQRNKWCVHNIHAYLLYQKNPTISICSSYITTIAIFWRFIETLQ